MKISNVAPTVIASLLLCGCQSATPEGWRRYYGEGIAFYLPSSLEKTSMHGIDSDCARFTNQVMSIDYDYGQWSGDPIYSSSDDSSHIENIDGKKAEIVSFDSDVSKSQRFTHFIMASFLGAGLTMTVNCKTTADYDTALRIFRSVRFRAVPKRIEN